LTEVTRFCRVSAFAEHCAATPTTLSNATLACCALFTSCTLTRRVPPFAYALNLLGCAWTSQQVEDLFSAITISSTMLRSARADYMEVLLIQHDTLGSCFEPVETRMQQMNAMVNIYQAVGGGWR
jgi:hypothetical protein